MGIDTVLNAGKRIVIGLALTVALSSCAGPALAQRDYGTSPESRRKGAYHDMERIIADICCPLLGDSYPDCKYLRLNQTGFRCVQFPPEGDVVSDYRWDEIVGVKCLGSRVLIQGQYNSSVLYTKGPGWQDTTQQCLDLAEAMQIFLEERKGN